MSGADVSRCKDKQEKYTLLLSYLNWMKWVWLDVPVKGFSSVILSALLFWAENTKQETSYLAQSPTGLIVLSWFHWWQCMAVLSGVAMVFPFHVPNKRDRTKFSVESALHFPIEEWVTLSLLKSSHCIGVIWRQRWYFPIGRWLSSWLHIPVKKMPSECSYFENFGRNAVTCKDSWKRKGVPSFEPVKKPNLLFQFKGVFQEKL